MKNQAVRASRKYLHPLKVFVMLFIFYLIMNINIK